MLLLRRVLDVVPVVLVVEGRGRGRGWRRWRWRGSHVSRRVPGSSARVVEDGGGGLLRRLAVEGPVPGPRTEVLLLLLRVRLGFQDFPTCHVGEHVSSYVLIDKS